jgi:hypothetical protein
MVDRKAEMKVDRLALVELESALGEFEAGGWHSIKRRRAFIAAARAVVEAPEVWWCEIHGIGEERSNQFTSRTCCATIHPAPSREPCRMIRVFLVPAEEES